MNHVATAVRSALRSFEEPLQVVTVTRTRALGRTQASESEPKTFSGVIAPAEQWKQIIAPGGEISATRPVLVVDGALLDSQGSLLAINKNDILVRGDGQRFQILEKFDEAERYGIVLYTLTESRV